MKAVFSGHSYMHGLQTRFMLATSVMCVFWTSLLHAQVPAPALVGYFHNWNDPAAPYVQLDQVDARYNVVAVAFATPEAGTDYRMVFVPDQVTPAVFASQIQTLKSQGRRVLLSIGGATAPVSLDSPMERDTFIASVGRIIAQFGFDGIDIDLEGASLSVSGGTIQSPIDLPIIHLIEAIRTIMTEHRQRTGSKLVLTFAPETAFVQGGQSAYGGVWGAYLPVLHALRDSLDLLMVQLYNSGSMYGIDGGIYFPSTVDFVVAMAEAVISGFNTAGGFFQGFPASKIAVALPACPSAAGSGYVPPATLNDAVHYLTGAGAQPGNYLLQQPAGYPDLAGMMTWSINWDAVSTCASVYGFATVFENLFSNPSTDIQSHSSCNERVLIDQPGIRLHICFERPDSYRIIGISGAEFSSGRLSPPVSEIDISGLPPGCYFFLSDRFVGRFVKP